MGAWYSVVQDPQVVGASLLKSLETSGGSLTAPAPLAVAAATLLGADAISSLKVYAASDAGHRDGSAAFAAAVAGHLGATEISTLYTESDLEAAERMLDVARKIADAE
jgi:hypothetical protein